MEIIPALSLTGRAAQAAVVAVLLVARDAQVYLPPAYFAHPRPKLPVVVLVSGVPGSPEQWFAEGRAGQALDAFAEDHRGLAPITVAVDANGTVFNRGGSCALQMSLTHPGTYPTFLSMSPQKRPVDENPAETVATYFRGDGKAYDAIDPLKILETARFGGGAHTWRAWAAGFAESLPWLSARLGLTGEDS